MKTPLDDGAGVSSAIEKYLEIRAAGTLRKLQDLLAQRRRFCELQTQTVRQDEIPASPEPMQPPEMAGERDGADNGADNGQDEKDEDDSIFVPIHKAKSDQPLIPVSPPMSRGIIDWD